jgi:hypothetical protein
MGATYRRRLSGWPSEPNTRQAIPRRHRRTAGMPHQAKLALRAVGYEGIYHLPDCGKLSAPEAEPIGGFALRKMLWRRDFARALTCR